MARKSITSLSAENESLREKNQFLLRNAVVSGDLLADIDKALTGRDNSMAVWPEFPSMIVDLKHALSQEQEAHKATHERIAQLHEHIDSLLKQTSDLAIQLDRSPDKIEEQRDLMESGIPSITKATNHLLELKEKLEVSTKNNGVLIKANMRQSGVIRDLQRELEDDERKLLGVANERDVLMAEVIESRKFLHDHVGVDLADMDQALITIQPLIKAQSDVDDLFPTIADTLGMDQDDAIIRDIRPSTGTQGPIL